MARTLCAGDRRGADTLLSMLRRGPDLRAEKILSRRFRFLWIANPKVASCSIALALRKADPDAEHIRGKTLEQIFALRSEARSYVSFAFIRHPCRRILSFYEDKHVRLGCRSSTLRYFIEPHHGIRQGMTFPELCEWLNTPCGADAFAERHWLSQNRLIRLPDGRLPDCIGSYERLDDDWRAIAERIGIPFRPLPHLNSSRDAATRTRLDARTGALLRRRYADDLQLGGYDG